MTLHLTRESVCMGDDVDAPHTGLVDLPSDLDLGSILRRIYKDRYLASVAGGATWSVWHDSTVLATLHIGLFGMGEPLFAVGAAHLQAQNLDPLYFGYHCAADPAAVLLDPKIRR